MDDLLIHIQHPTTTETVCGRDEYLRRLPMNAWDGTEIYKDTHGIERPMCAACTRAATDLRAVPT